MAKQANVAVLPPEIASRIAAGEVIERPASVVKELVENALDALARRVEITLEDGGRAFIQVSDDGEGMSLEDARMSVQRHATSKIRSANDLFSINTYGFRGEALPSIASVSEFELVTKRAEDAHATRIFIRGGITESEGSVAAPDGTTIKVSKLFENVPARQKFMKSAQTEMSRSVDFIQRMVLARPEVAFTLRHGLQETLTHPGGDIISGLVTVFGRQIAREFIPVENEGTISLKAFLAPPTRTRPNRTQQFFFVNGRAIGSRMISHAVDEAYSGMLPHGRYPIVVLLITLPPDMVDVNIHPRKAEVKFLNEHEAHSLVFHTVRDALIGKGLVPRVSPTAIEPAQLQTQGFSFEPTAFSLSGQVEAGSQAIQTDTPSAFQGVTTGQEDIRPESTHLADQGLQPDQIRILGQIASTYIVAETREGLAIIDQHVAHERVLYERFRKRSNDHSVQMLAVPVTIELSKREALIVMERLPEFAELGFIMEPFGPDTMLLRGIPAGIKLDTPEPAIRDMIEHLVELTLEKKMLAPREAVVTSAACKAAVKAGDKMSEPEMRALIAQLLECENPYVCPHGRPIIVRLDRTSLEKIFQR